MSVSSTPRGSSSPSHHQLNAASLPPQTQHSYRLETPHDGATAASSLVQNDAITLSQLERQRSLSLSLSAKQNDATAASSSSSSSSASTALDADLHSHADQRIPGRPYSPLPIHEHGDSDARETESELTVRLIAFYNAHSGGKQGMKVAATLRRELGDDCVFDLALCNPLDVLQRHLRTANLRVAVCGGDGTVNWLLTCIALLPFHPVPPVGILPLGTGNDTSRVFGWGHSYKGRRRVLRNLRIMRTCASTPFDRWHCSIEHAHPLNDEQILCLPAAVREQTKEPVFLGYQPPPLQLQTGSSDAQFVAAVEASVESPRSVTQHAQKKLDHLERVGSASLIKPSSANDSSSPAASAVASSSSSSLSTVSSSQSAPQNGLQLQRNGSSSTTRASSSPPLNHEHDPSLAVVLRREAQFNNYLSFGIDAQIQYEFHEHREHNRYLYHSRLINMGWMTGHGFMNLVCCSARPLIVKIEVPSVHDGSWHELALPRNLRSIVLLNGTTYAGGRSIWGKSKSRKNEFSGSPPSYNDGLIEIMGTESTIHLTMMLIKIRRAIRIAQVHECRITTLSPIHVQLDGEPWAEQNAVYHIRRIHQALMLVNHEKIKKK